MSAILQRIHEVEVQNKINMTEYEMGGGQSPPLHNSHYGLANLHEEYGKGGIQNNLEMYRNLKGT